MPWKHPRDGRSFCGFCAGMSHASCSTAPSRHPFPFHLTGIVHNRLYGTVVAHTRATRRMEVVPRSARQTMRWCSVKWPSGTTYEGVSDAGVSHGHGVVRFGNGDRYEGEFRRGEMHGPGIYYWSEGAMHRGDWKRGVMNGCGVREEADREPLVGEFVDDVYAGDAIGCSRVEAQVSRRRQSKRDGSKEGTWRADAAH